MDASKTIVRKPAPTMRSDAEPSVRRTIPIPVDEIFDDIPMANTSLLHVILPDQDPVDVELAKDDVYIGRDESCRICLPLTNVSRQHARLVCRGEEYVLEDLDSTNGTFINNVRVSRCVLRNNDHIRIGEARMQFLQEKKRQRT